MDVKFEFDSSGAGGGTGGGGQVSGTGGGRGHRGHTAAKAKAETKAKAEMAEAPPFAFAEAPGRGNFSSERWTAANCCSPRFAQRVDLRKWTQLNGSGAILCPRPWDVGHIHLVEPLSVAAFVAAIFAWKRSPSPTSGFVLDIGMNVGWYTWVASAIAPELSVIGVDMQPNCIEVAKCGLRLLNRERKGAIPANVHLLRNYVSNSTDDATIYIPENQCGTPNRNTPHESYEAPLPPALL